MLASDIDSSEINDLISLWGCSRTQAERLKVNAARLLRAGHNPSLRPGIGNAPGPAQAATGPSTGVRDRTPEPEPPSLEEEAASMARRIKGESAGVAGASIANLRSRLAVCERNLQAGYPEWSYQARLLRRTLDLVEVPF